MNKLKKLELKNIKGISSKSFDLDFFPNKPIIFVAPNGFGKSSIACGFQSLKSNKLELEEENYHLNNSTLTPEITIELDSTMYYANSLCNTISSKFDYYVINSPLFAKS